MATAGTNDGRELKNEHDRAVLRRFSEAVRNRFGAAAIWAFGSRARGDAAPDSDLDVCVVLDALTREADRAVMRLAWEIGFEHDVVISTITYSRAEFEHGPCSQSPLVRAILREGIAA